MKLIVGLGNPGDAYNGTRHNVGFEVVEEVARRWGLVFRSTAVQAVAASSPRIPDERDAVILVKPLTYMNRSGLAVDAVRRYYRIGLADLLVITEDVNLALGHLRARRQGSAGGHNGLRSVIEVVTTEEFSRIRVGVGRGDPRIALSARVLSRFSADERSKMDEAVDRAAEAAALFVGSGIDEVMNTFNRREIGTTEGAESGAFEG